MGQMDEGKSEWLRFKEASAYSGNVLELPVRDVVSSSQWYQKHFGMVETERIESSVPQVILERDGIKIGLAENGGDSSQNGAAILVEGLDEIEQELEAAGVNIANRRIDDRDGQKFNVFFVVAPDGLCYLSLIHI